MLRTPLQLQQMPKTAFDFTVPYTLRDRCGHVLGGSFTAAEGAEVLRRCNAYDALVLALRTIRDNDMPMAERHAVADQALAIAGEP